MPSGYNFSERVRRVLADARNEASRLGHGYVGAEHILLGLLLDDDGVGIAALRDLAGDAATIRAAVEVEIRPGNAPSSGMDLPYTSRAKKSIELAMDEARELRHTYIGTEHLLLGLIREGKSVAAFVLDAKGVTLERAREKVLALLGPAR